MAWNGPRTLYRERPDGSRTEIGKAGVEMEFRTEGYEMACGDTATIVTAREQHGAEEYIAYFVHGGVLYEVHPLALAGEGLEAPDFRELAEKILDSFEAPGET